MHKYTMRIDVEVADHSSKYSFDLPNTAFIAVPAYQNPELAELKISKNPCSKAHRQQKMQHTTEKAAIKKNLLPSPFTSATPRISVASTRGVGEKKHSDSSSKTGSEGLPKDEMDDLLRIKDLVSRKLLLGGHKVPH